MCGITLKAICLVNFLDIRAVADEDVARLFEQLVHARLARARHRLIGSDDDALDRRGIVQRLERDDHLRGRAVRVRDDVAAGIAVDRLRDSLRARSAARRGPCDRATNCRSRRSRQPQPSARGSWSPRCRSRTSPCPSRSSRNARYSGILTVLPVSPNLDLVALAARRCDRGQLVDREFALGQDGEHFAPDIAGRAGDNDTITHLLTPQRRTRLKTLGRLKLSSESGRSADARTARPPRGHRRRYYGSRAGCPRCSCGRTRCPCAAGARRPSA
jgi:hypothetical protein